MALLVLGLFAELPSAQAADIEIVTPELPWAVIDKPYAPPPLEVRSSGTCPLGGVGYSVVGGVLPPGVQLSRLGYFSGSPLRTGVFLFGIRVSNGCTWTARRFALTVTGAPVITVSPTRLVFLDENEKSAVERGEGEKVLHVSATWPNLPYQVTASADWLKVSTAHGVTPRESSAMAEDRVIVAVDRAALKPGHYSAKIAFTAWQALAPGSVAVEMDVAEKPVDAIEKPAPTGSPTSVSLP